MRKTLWVLGFLSAPFLLTGCGNQDSADKTAPLTKQTQQQASTEDKKTPVTPTANPTTAQNSLEAITPKATNDLPTAIDETQKDLEVIENDLKEIEQMDLAEESIEL